MNLIDIAAQARNIRKTFFHHPVNLQIGLRTPEVGNRRHGMDHVSHGGRFNYQSAARHIDPLIGKQFGFQLSAKLFTVFHRRLIKSI